MTGSTPRYEAVFWDIGGVLVDLRSVRAGYATFVCELAEEHGLDPDAARETWRNTLGEYFRGRDGTEYRPARKGYRRATAALFDGDPPADWAATFDRATSDVLRAEPGAVEAVETLADAGLIQAIVSDIDTREAESIVSTFGIRDRFAHVTTSEAVGYKKPDERMFRDALLGTGVEPEEALMVGDRYEHDVEGAVAVGLSAAAYGEDAWGPAATHELETLQELPTAVGVDDAPGDR
jgi:putative hydrolase of the HAD superfamily